MNTSKETNTVREPQSAENYDATAKQKSAAKLSRIPVKVVQGEILRKPEWIRVKAGSPTTRFYAATSWSPCAKKPVVPTLVNVLARARPLS
jgi:hypothetical protein